MNYLEATAMYFQIKESLKEYIKANHLISGDKLPSEKELMEMYEASRITVRRALEELEHEGYITKSQGKGTFVANPRIQNQLSYLSSFTEDMQSRGYTTFAKVLNNKIIKAPKNIAQSLQLNANENVVLIERIRYANDKPIALESCYLSAELFGDLICEDFSTQSLNHMIETKYNIKFSYAEQFISTEIAKKKLMQIFSIEKPIAILAMRRISYDETNRPIQYTLSYYRGDIYEYEVVLPIRNNRH
ncbi:MAG: GntR family transcriptional regulator, N-acetylglucosamine utilization regulator [Clostridiales bacterium]|nr:GntR family transcriptional regulator, N-acetylglucosamine utilization regulator [Clostridiales bacterium]